MRANFDLVACDKGGYAYDAEKRLIHAANGATSVDFLYDPLGRCLRRSVNGVATHVTYEGWQPLIDWDGAGHFQAYSLNRPGAADQILMRCDAAHGVTFLHQDGRLGSVQYLSASDGGVYERYRYDAYGSPAIADWGGANPRGQSAYRNRFLFTGREYLAELSLYDLRHRLYKPEVLGGFLQPDPAGYAANPSGNLYAYGGNDPVNFSDPGGLKDEGHWDPKAPTRPQNAFSTGSLIPTADPTSIPGYSIAGGFELGLATGGAAAQGQSGNGFWVDNLLPNVGSTLVVSSTWFSTPFVAPGGGGRGSGGSGFVRYDEGGAEAVFAYFGSQTSLGRALNTSQKISYFAAEQATFGVVGGFLGEVFEGVAVLRATFGAAKTAPSFFEGASYTPKVLKQMQGGVGEFHSFPESVTAFESAGTVRTITGGDNVVRQMLEIPGSYGSGGNGVFQFIKNADGTINHRLFVPNSP